MPEVLLEQPYYFLHTLVGNSGRAFGPLMTRHNRAWPPLRKMETFLGADPESAEGASLALGLDLREVMCTVSRKSPAVTYHSPFGLVLEGSVKACFDNDTGKVLTEDGTYNDATFDFTHESTPDQLMGEWYEKFTHASRFTWNEVILEKNSKIIGAFHDPRIESMRVLISDCREPKLEYSRFMEKVQKCGLALLEITDKFSLH